MRGIPTLVALALAALFFTNPTTDEYVSWVVQQAQPSDAGALGVLLVRALGSPLVKASTVSKNFALFSVFETSLDQNTRIIAIGAFHAFIPLPMPVRWTPGSRHPNSPHVLATEQTDRWIPEDGYTWVANPPPGDMQVRWTVGIASRFWPHVVAAETDGRWYPEDGYTWVVIPPPPNDLRVRWTAGLRSKLHQHIVAAPQERRWFPEGGYRWVDNPPSPGDFRVEPVSEIALSNVPRFRGVSLRHCTEADHFQPETPCWFEGANGKYVASRYGTSSAATFRNWPDVDDELAGIERLSVNQVKAHCSFVAGALQCPSPGAGMCWAKSHDPSLDEPPMSIDVGNPGTPTFGHSELCSSGMGATRSPERTFLLRELH